MQVKWSLAVSTLRIFSRVIIKELNYRKSNKKRILYIEKKKKNKQIYKVSQFLFMSFHILKILRFIINTTNYISFKF